ncbi:MAG TPA: hypothetical protein PK733_10305, partial [Clostridiales bacterium]|nr:hypothetical protein [Clostridiales bacterium]
FLEQHFSYSNNDKGFVVYGPPNKSKSGIKEFWFCSNTSSKRVVQIQKTLMPAFISMMRKPSRV